MIKASSGETQFQIKAHAQLLSCTLSQTIFSHLFQESSCRGLIMTRSLSTGKMKKVQNMFQEKKSLTLFSQISSKNSGSSLQHSSIMHKKNNSVHQSKDILNIIVGIGSCWFVTLRVPQVQLKTFSITQRARRD